MNISRKSKHTKSWLSESFDWVLRACSCLSSRGNNFVETSDTYQNFRHADDERSSAIANLYQAVKSICATAIHSIQKLYLGQTSVAILVPKLRWVFSGEPLPSIIVGHLKILHALNRSGARALIRRNPYYVNKYARSYLATSLSTAQRREILIFGILESPFTWPPIIAVCVDGRNSAGEVSALYT